MLCPFSLGHDSLPVKTFLNRRREMETTKDTAKTLDRGLAVLDFIAENGPKKLTEIATGLDIHRTIVTRLIRTLESRSLVHRDANGRFFLGVGLVRLAAPVRQDLRAVAQPILQKLAESVGATANLTVADGPDIVVLETYEPRNANAHIAYRIGQRHPLVQGATGLAILAARPPVPGEREIIRQSREAGFAVTRAEVVPGTCGVSAAVKSGGEAEASIGVSLFDTADEQLIGLVGARVAAAALEISNKLV
jgi:DNA-binding IclR family transcriptional regulator